MIVKKIKEKEKLVNINLIQAFKNSYSSNKLI